MEPFLAKTVNSLKSLSIFAKKTPSLPATGAIAPFLSKFSISSLKIFESLSCFWDFYWARGIWVISSNSIFTPLTVLSTNLSEVISFHFLGLNTIFPALNFLFDILIDS